LAIIATPKNNATAKMVDIGPLAIPEVHEKFIEFLKSRFDSIAGIRVLDAGAGQGALTKRLAEMGCEVSACDLCPDLYRYSEVECKQADLSKALPYANGDFDVAVAVEVVEHLLDCARFFEECARVLKPGGKLLITTPNILSLKSRVRYLMTGFCYSFGPIDAQDDSGLAHISSRTVDQYRYIARRYGMKLDAVSVDTAQRSSKMLLWLWPMMKLFCRTMRTEFDLHNSTHLLLGRTLFLEFRRLG